MHNTDAPGQDHSPTPHRHGPWPPARHAAFLEDAYPRIKSHQASLRILARSSTARGGEIMAQPGLLFAVVRNIGASNGSFTITVMKQ